MHAQLIKQDYNVHAIHTTCDPFFLSCDNMQTEKDTYYPYWKLKLIQKAEAEPKAAEHASCKRAMQRDRTSGSSTELRTA